MKQFTIKANESTFRGDSFGVKCLAHDVKAFYNSSYIGGEGLHNVPGRIENVICTLKNDITPKSPAELKAACDKLAQILKTDLPEILQSTGLYSLRVCVIPRAKKEDFYKPNQLYLRATIQKVVQSLSGFEDGTHDIIRHTNTKTTHRAAWGYGGDGRMPYAGITNDTCNISNEVKDKNILLIDDLYTKTVNIDEDCIQALYDKGAKNVYFYSVGKTMSWY